MSTDLKIAVIDDDPGRAAILEEGLRQGGHDNIVHVPATSDLLARLAAVAPDVIVVDLGNPSRDVLEQMFAVSRLVPRPVAMFVDRSDAQSIEAAIEAGVSAYIVDGLRPERVKAVLDTAMHRYRAFARLKANLEQARSELEERKLIDRAKAILNKRKGLSEEDAHRLLRRTAMNENRRIAEVAQALITAAALLE